MPARVTLGELHRAECLRLLAQAAVGRVVCTEAALPAAHPVGFVLDGEEVVFRTADGGLVTATVGRVVGFQADEIDPAGRVGWSVLGVGEAYEVRDPDRLAVLTGRRRALWAPRSGVRVVAVPLQRLTGRRLCP